jgi:hypothetical protein
LTSNALGATLDKNFFDDRPRAIRLSPSVRLLPSESFTSDIDQSTSRELHNEADPTHCDVFFRDLRAAKLCL